jgi:hypothetical protein
MLHYDYWKKISGRAEPTIFFKQKCPLPNDYINKTLLDAKNIIYVTSNPPPLKKKDPRIL